MELIANHCRMATLGSFNAEIKADGGSASAIVHRLPREDILGLVIWWATDLWVGQSIRSVPCMTDTGESSYLRNILKTSSIDLRTVLEVLRLFLVGGFETELV